MAIQKIKNSLLFGLAADSKPATYADNTIFYEQDTGNVYRSTSGSWSLLQGASKTETLTNKTMDYPTNTVKGYIHYNRNKRFSYSYITNTTMGYIGFMGGLNLAGTATRSIDSTGLHVDLATGTSSNTRVGMTSASAQTVTSMPSYLPQMYVKFATNSAAASRFYFGFSSATTIPASDTPLATADSGVFIGWAAGDVNFQIFNNDGSAAAVKTAYSPTTAVDTAVHTASMVWTTASNVVITLDAFAPVTLTTRIPASSITMVPYVSLTNSTTTSKSLSLYYIDGEQLL